MIQVKPVCVLDFYVHESLQRRGLGARLLTLACQVRPGVTSGVMICVWVEGGGRGKERSKRPVLSSTPIPSIERLVLCPR